ncbi:peptidoglycan bridge formation glycyltransferase FemA/FemB family protein [soil metagenome]
MTAPVQPTAPYAVREVEGVSRSQWNDWLQDSPAGGHVFQSYEWGEFKRNLGWTPLRIVLEREGEIVGCGQFLLYKTTPVPGALMYSPKGPWLPWDDEAAVRAFFEGVRKIAEEHGVHTVKIEPEILETQEDTKSLLGELGFQKFRWDLNFKTTMVVDLEPAEEDLLANMKKDTRYGVRRAGREEVQVVEDNSAEAREDFWRMFEQTAERKAFWYRPREYQFAAWQSMYDTERAHLFFAAHEGERLAGAISYMFGEKCWYIQAAAVDYKRNLQPTYLLQWEIMRWAKQNGATCYDMMAVPGPDELDESHPLYGVYKFKAGFGSEMRDFIGCFDLPIKHAQERLWNRVEPTYYRLYRKLKGDVYY